MAAASRMSVDAAIWAVLSALDGILTLKEKHKNTEGFSRRTTFGTFTPKVPETVVHNGRPRGSNTRLMLCSNKSDSFALISYSSPSPNAIHRLFTRYICLQIPNAFGKVPSAVPGWIS